MAIEPTSQLDYLRRNNVPHAVLFEDDDPFDTGVKSAVADAFGYEDAVLGLTGITIYQPGGDSDEQGRTNSVKQPWFEAAEELGPELLEAAERELESSALVFRHQIRLTKPLVREGVISSVGIEAISLLKPGKVWIAKDWCTSGGMSFTVARDANAKVDRVMVRWSITVKPKDDLDHQETSVM